MKFVLGPVPENIDFHPEDGDWFAIKEPSPWVMQICATPIAVVTTFLLLATWAIVLPSGGLGGSIGLEIILFPFVFLLLIPIHEFIHVLCHPLNGRSQATYIGCWPRKGLFYAHYDDELSRNRFLFILFAPFALLSLVPICLSYVFSYHSAFLILLSVMNGMGSAGDLLGVILITLQIRKSTVLRNKGYRTWWRKSLTTNQ
jgi:hypothetical protein